jgi:hypothetical protein
MRKYWAMAAVVALAVSGGAWAADLANGNGQSCGSGSLGTWHFVNNQTDGAAPGTLTATFTDPASTCVVGPSKVNQNTQHFICVAAGTLVDASTDLPGRLVLSDFTCVKKPEPPK